MISPLPSELINEILSHCDFGSLNSCALTNHTLLDFTRSYLYSDISWANEWCRPIFADTIVAYPHLLSHTRHLTIDPFGGNGGVFDVLSSPLVDELLLLGKLESLTLAVSFPDPSDQENNLTSQASVFRLVSMPSVIWISLFLDEYTDSPGVIPFLSSPKLRDLSLVLRPAGTTTSDFIMDNPALKFLFHSPNIPDLSNVRSLDILLWRTGDVAECIAKLFTACKNLTHLSLPFPWGLSSLEIDFPGIFIPMEQLSSLTSLFVAIDMDMSNIEKSLNQMSFIFKHFHPKAPMRSVSLRIHWLSPWPPQIQLSNHPSLEVLRSILKCREDPTCQLIVDLPSPHPPTDGLC